MARMRMGSVRRMVSRGMPSGACRKGRAVRSAAGPRSPPLKTNWNMGPTSQEKAPVAAESTTIEAMAAASSPLCGRTAAMSRRYSCICPRLVAWRPDLVRTAPMQAFGRFLFRWRSFTPVLLLAVAVPLLWRSRGPASPLWLVAGLLLCASGQALRAWVLGQVPDGTSGQNEKLIATSLNTAGPYELTRNPLYLGNLGITLGLCLIAHDPWLLGIVLLLFAVQYRAIIAAEERFLRERFGVAYEAWCARVPRFWPRLATPSTAHRWDWRRALRKEHNPLAAWIALSLV